LSLSSPDQYRSSRCTKPGIGQKAGLFYKWGNNICGLLLFDFLSVWKCNAGEDKFSSWFQSGVIQNQQNRIQECQKRFKSFGSRFRSSPIEIAAFSNRMSEYNQTISLSKQGKLTVVLPSADRLLFTANKFFYVKGGSSNPCYHQLTDCCSLLTIFFNVKGGSSNPSPILQS
jgi:hypothetical protein